MQNVAGCTYAQGIADSVIRTDRKHRLVPDFDEYADRTRVPVSCAQAVQATLEACRCKTRRLFAACESANHPQVPRHVSQAARLQNGDRETFACKTIDIAAPVTTAPRQHEVRAQPVDSLQINACGITYHGQAGCGGRIIGTAHRGNQTFASPGREHHLGQVRGKRDDALCRRLDTDVPAQIVDERDLRKG